jgi:hypothetical protein
MFLTELFDTELTELAPDYVNQVIKQQSQGKFKNLRAWDKLGQGATASVWQHYQEPDTVVKVVGGGDYEAQGGYRNITLAFIHFLVDHGHTSKHYPIVHGINIDDAEVLQIRMEKLLPISSGDVRSGLSRLANAVTGGAALTKSKIELLSAMKYSGIQGMKENNNVDEIVEAIKYLSKALPVYLEAHNINEGWIDLHGGNWLMRPNGTIIAADPWYSEADQVFSDEQGYFYSDERDERSSDVSGDKVVSSDERGARPGIDKSGSNSNSTSFKPNGDMWAPGAND